MGLLKILRKSSENAKKVVFIGLDGAGKSTIVSFIKKGSFLEHEPTMGKELTSIQIQGVDINIMDMGGQKDFRGYWLDEIHDADCVIFVLDILTSKRFKEAKAELWKIVPSIKNKSLIVLANKSDLDPLATVKDAVNALDLMKLPSFDVMQVSCKTGFGMMNALSKIFHKLTGKHLGKKITAKALTIFDQGGVPLTTAELNDINQVVLRGGLFKAIMSFVKESFNSELNQLKLDKHLIIFQKTDHLMGSIILDDSEGMDIQEAEIGLKDLLIHLENMCPELNTNKLDPDKIQYLVEQYSTNIFT